MSKNYTIKNSKFKLDWVLINELAIGKLPTIENDLIYLKGKGIKSILSLCNKDEIVEIENLNNFKYKVVVLPDHKTGKLPSIKDLRHALQELKKLMAFGPTFVHCVASVERSPLLCMCYLVNEKNLTPLESLEYLMQVHPRTNPLASQLELLNEFNN